ncbi:MAG: flavodoxin family protein [Deltaproteobacteria bacterium]|nr:flavodoxin family protein [Deltaproteobacteria bacterium]
MKCLAILGSPRKGANSSIIAQTMLDTASKLGAITETFVLKDMDYSGCIACNSCKTKTVSCVLEDDLTQVLESIKSADIMILATPNYFGEVSGQFKCFFDRTYSFLNPDYTGRLDPGKKSVFILTQGNPDPKAYPSIYPRHERWLKVYGFGENELVVAAGVQKPGQVEGKQDLLRQTEALIRRWMVS